MSGGGRRVAVALTALALCVAGCAPAHSRAASPASGRPSVASPGPGPSSPGPSAPAEFCRVDLPAAWRSALAAGHLAHGPAEAAVPQAVAPDGRSVFVDSYVDGVRAVVWLRDGGQHRQTVMRLANDVQQVIGADFDGRWLVFSVSDEPILDSPWTLYAWDSATGGPVRRLGRATVPGPFAYPVAVSGKAFWTTAVDDHRSLLHLADLATGVQQVVRDGVPGYPFHYGDLVVWPEMAPGTDPITLRAADPATGQPVPLPRELDVPLARPAFENGDAGAFVWSDQDLKRLRVWRRGETGPVTILDRAPIGTYLQWPRVAGDIVSWDDGTAMFAADLRSGAYVQLTPQNGLTLLSAGALLVTYAPTGPKSSHAVLDSTLVPLRDLPPLPGCR